LHISLGVSVGEKLFDDLLCETLGSLSHFLTKRVIVQAGLCRQRPRGVRVSTDQGAIGDYTFIKERTI